MRIGVFDSGVGGLSVVSSIIKSLDHYEIFYLGDTSRVPYGNRSAKTVLKYAENAVDFLVQFNLDCLVIACNTASAIASKELSKKLSLPVIDVVDPLVELLDESYEDILLIATRSTINSESYQKAIAKKLPNTKLRTISTPLFVPLVEEGLLSGEILYHSFHHYFSETQKPQALILGCTHYPFLFPELKNYFGEKTEIFSSGPPVAALLKDKFKSEVSSKSLEIFLTDKPDNFSEMAISYLGLNPKKLDWVDLKVRS